jgi:hypothetical protein
MIDMQSEFFKSILEARHEVIRQGGRPNTLKISRQAIEKFTLFGLDIEVVESVVLPKDTVFIVVEDKDKLI